MCVCWVYTALCLSVFPPSGGFCSSLFYFIIKNTLFLHLSPRLHLSSQFLTPIILISAVGGEQLRSTAQSDTAASPAFFWHMYVIMTSEQGGCNSDTFLTGMHLVVITGDRFCADFAPSNKPSLLWMHVQQIADFTQNCLYRFKYFFGPKCIDLLQDAFIYPLKPCDPRFNMSACTLFDYICTVEHCHPPMSL